MKTFKYKWSLGDKEFVGARDCMDETALKEHIARNGGRLIKIIEVSEKPEPPPPTKKCPYCAEEIHAEAIKCRHCGEMLTKGIGLITGTEPKKSEYESTPAFSGYAGFWRRFVAFFIDTIILFIADYLIGFIIGFIMASIIIGIMGSVVEAFKITTIMAAVIAAMIFNWLYFTLLESSSKQATLGKMALGIVVTDMSGSRISFGRANGRYWGKIVSALILNAGFIMAGITQKKQALHDIMAETLVVKG